MGAGFGAGWNGLENAFPLLTLLSCVGFAFTWLFPDVRQRCPIRPAWLPSLEHESPSNASIRSGRPAGPSANGALDLPKAGHLELQNEGARRQRWRGLQGSPQGITFQPSTASYSWEVSVSVSQTDLRSKAASAILAGWPLGKLLHLSEPPHQPLMLCFQAGLHSLPPGSIHT